MAEVEDDSARSERITRQSEGAQNSLVGEFPSKRKILSPEDALDALSSVDNNTKVRGNVKVHLAIEDIVSHSMEYGLQPAQLTLLMNIIIKSDSRLTQAMKSKLIKCLVPSSSVPEDVVISAICFISQNIFVSPGPSNLEVLLLRWMLLVMDFIDSYKKMHKLYGLIFNFIHCERLLPYVCQLLFLLTQKDDVRLFRVEQLKDVMKKTGPDPGIIGLLTCYKVFQPSLVSVKLRSSHKTFFKAHDSLWRSTIISVIHKNSTQSNKSRESVWEKERKHQRLLMQPVKRQKQMIPKVHSAARENDAETAEREESYPVVPFEQVESFVHFLQVIENIQCPSQMASSLSDSRLQLLLSCNPDQIAMTRLCMWIQHFFVFGFDRKTCEGQGQEERNNALLKLLCQFSDNVQSLPVVHGFLESFLPYWNGHSYIPVLFSLITSIQPCSYEELQTSILQPLFKLFFASDVYFKVLCVSTLTKLVKKFVMFMFTLQASPKGDSSARQEHNRMEDSMNCEIVKDSLANQEELLIYQDCIQQLMKYLDIVLVVAMRMEKDHILLQHGTLDLLEMIANAYMTYKVPILCLPIRIIYRLLLSDCPATLARLCGVINSFRDNLTRLRAEGMITEEGSAKEMQPSSSSVNSACLDVTLNNADPSTFNSLLVDVVKMLWHGTIFTASKTVQYKSVFHFSFPKSMESQANGKCLTLYRGPAFVGLAYKFLKEIDFRGSKLNSPIVEDFKEIYLEFLERENFSQFKEFVNINLKSRQMKARISNM